MTKNKVNDRILAYPFLNALNIDQDVKRRLSYLLAQTVEGNQDVYTTPIGADGNAYKILSKLDKVFKDATVNINSVLSDLESANKEKFGPRSISKTWSDRKESLLSSFKPLEGRRGTCKLIHPSSQAKLRPISLLTAIKLLKNNTNSGLPYFISKGRVKPKVLDEFGKLVKERYPCILFTRTQESGKTRNVWGYPIADTLNEMLFYAPLLDYQKQYAKYRSAIHSPDIVCNSMTILVKRCKKENKVMVSIDFGEYDNTVKTYLQDQAFNYIKALFQDKYADDIDYIRQRFNSIEIITPDGILKGEHGVPSGSTFTNEVDSIVQFLIGISLPFVDELSVQIQGDDGVYLIPKGYEDELINKFESFGLKVNKSKSYKSSDYAIYLQNLFHIDYLNVETGLIGGIYPLYRALNRICFQERWSNFEDYEISGQDYYSIRAICIMENCKHHPLFKEFVKLIFSEDKYALKFSKQGLFHYIHMMNETQGLGGIINNQYGDDVKGIRSFETFKIINSLG